MTKAENQAVLTGDLIASSAAPDRAEAAMRSLAQTAGEIARWTGQDARFTRFRGDGWQMLLPRPGLALRAGLLITARLAARPTLATRIAIGIGPVTHPGTTDLADARGAAFEASGHALDTLPRSARWAIAGDIAPWQTALVALADWHSARWTQEQAEAVALSLPPDAPAQTALAARLHITRQAFAARLSGAGLAAWHPALTAFEGA